MAYLPPMNGGRLNANITGNTANAGTMLSSGTMFLAGGSNVTLGQTGASIGINSPTFINSNGVTFGTNGASVTASVAAGAGGLSVSAGNSSGNVTGLTLSNSNNLSFGMSNAVITASYGQSIQTQNNVQAISAGNSVVATGTVSFINSNGMSFGLSNQSLTASYSTSAYIGGISGGNSLMNTGTLQFVNSNSVSFGLSNGSLTASVSQASPSVNFSAGGSSANLASVTFSNANGVAFGLSNGTITASHNAITSQSLQTSNIIQAAAAAGTGNASTMTNGTLLFSNSNSITFGLSNGVLTASAAPDGIQGISAAGASANNGAITFSNSNNVNFGMAGSVITASANVAGGGVAVAAGGATFSTGTLGIAAAGGISLATAAQSLTFSAPPVSSITATNITLNTNGSTIGFSGPAMFDAGIIGGGAGSTLGTSGSTNTNGMGIVAGSNVTLSQSTNAAGAYVTINAGAATIPRWEYPAGAFAPISTLSNSQLSIQHMNIPFNLTANSAKIGGSLSVNTTLVNSTASVSMSLWMGLYTLSGSTLSLVYSGSANNSFFYSNTSASATSYMTGINGMRQLTVPLNTISASQGNSATITAGDYWVGAVVASATNASNANNTFIVYGNNSANINPNAYLSPIGSNIANARDVFLFQGVYTANTLAGPQSIVGAQINNTTNSFVQRAAFYNLLYSATY